MQAICVWKKAADGLVGGGAHALTKTKADFTRKVTKMKAVVPAI